MKVFISSLIGCLVIGAVLYLYSTNSINKTGTNTNTLPVIDSSVLGTDIDATGDYEDKEKPFKSSEDNWVIEFKSPYPEITPIDEPERFIDVYDELVLKAEQGNIEELTILLSQLLRCSNSWTSFEELEAALALAETGKIQFSGSGRVATAVNSDVAKAAADQMRIDHYYCKGLSAEQINRYKDFAKAGSELGDLYATKIALDSVEDEYEKFILEQNLWNKIGHINGAAALSDRYFQGAVNDSGEVLPPDYQLSYAYLKVEEILHDASQNQHIGHGHTYEVPRESASHAKFSYFQEKNAKFGGLLKPDEELEAEILAREIINNNENCCASF